LVEVAGDFDFSLPDQLETITTDNFADYKAKYDAEKSDD